jgi:hypothetical protein
MEGFVALAAFAHEMSNLPEKLRSTQHPPSSDQYEEALLSMQNSTSAACRGKVHVEGAPPTTESRLPHSRPR